MLSYSTIVGNMSSNTSLPAAHRRTAVASFTAQVTTMANTLSGGSLESDDAGRAVTDGILSGAQSLVNLRSSSNRTDPGLGSKVIPLPTSTNIAGGFVRAVDPQNSTDAEVLYPDPDLVDPQSNPKVTGFTINVTAAASSNSSNTAALIGTSELAFAIVEFADDTLFPTNETVRMLTINNGTQRIGSSVLSASLSVPVSNLPDEHRVCGTYQYV